MVVAERPTAQSLPESSSAPPELLPGQLTGDQLGRAFRFLRLDYMATIAGTAGLPNAQRFEVVRERLAAYALALADALGDGADDAATVLAGRRQNGGRR